jgi:mono/diheme cytochrome c family protein
MNALFWQRMHGGTTHFPIALLLASVIFDLAARQSRDQGLRKGHHAAGLGSAVMGVLGGIGAVKSGLVLSHGQTLGGGYGRFHHLFVWPAFGMCVVLLGWRLLRREWFLQRGLVIYLAGMSLSSALMMGAGHWGGEMLLGADATTGPSASSSTTASITDYSARVSQGHQLFLMNCAHCHAPDATGDEGPNLHGVAKSDARIASLIKNGVKGEMPKFSAKLSDADIQALIAFIRSLHD